MQILRLDITGFPQAWLSPEQAAPYYATDSVCWTVGDVCTSLRGGMNSVTGRQSQIDLHPIIAVRGAAQVNLFDAVPSLTNAKLFKRDRYTCAYCGNVHLRGLTRDHIVPTSKGGLDVWQNVASACRGCNALKGSKLLHQAGMELLYTPYVPSVFEGFLLSGRHIRADVHEWLASRVSKNSRWYSSTPLLS